MFRGNMARHARVASLIRTALAIATFSMAAIATNATEIYTGSGGLYVLQSTYTYQNPFVFDSLNNLVGIVDVNDNILDSNNNVIGYIVP